MPSHRVRARDPREPVQAPRVLDEPEAVATFLSDSSRFPGGHSPRLYQPTHEGEVAWVLRHEARVLPIGAQSSLTGGATPRGDALLATAAMDRVGPLEGDRIRVQPGAALMSVQEVLAEAGAFYPPAPTYNGAYVGGTVSTNAAGAATWKYGTTRDWVEALTVVLASGHVLELRRGEVRASPEGRFQLELPDGALSTIPLPGYTMPDVPKRSAGYHAAPGMDLIDLFIGSEGTLGVIVDVELRVLPDAPPLLIGLVPVPSEEQAIELVRRLRDASRATWREQDPCGLDVRAVESMDRRCVELLREDGTDKQQGLELPEGTQVVLFVQLELPPGLDPEAALEAFGEDDAPDSPLGRYLELLGELDLLDDAELALPDDRARREQLLALREAVPVAVNHRVAAAKRDVHPEIHKVGGDMIVPFERFPEAMRRYRDEFGKRGLDLAVWGHISDGNVHPNLVPRALEDVEAAHEALLSCGQAVKAMGGCPLSEHGTGRNPFKQALLRGLYGEEGLEAMRRTKQALDPLGKLARGVVFPWDDGSA